MVRNIKFGTWNCGSFQVSKITILRGTGTDKVSFTLEGAPTPFPELSQMEPGKYLPVYSIEVRRGYAERWLLDTYGVRADQDPDIKVIDTTR